MSNIRTMVLMMESEKVVNVTLVGSGVVGINGKVVPSKVKLSSENFEDIYFDTATFFTQPGLYSDTLVHAVEVLVDNFED